jgi:hypothetical protein
MTLSDQVLKYGFLRLSSQWTISQTSILSSFHHGPAISIKVLELDLVIYNTPPLSHDCSTEGLCPFILPFSHHLLDVISEDLPGGHKRGLNIVMGYCYQWPYLAFPALSLSVSWAVAFTLYSYNLVFLIPSFLGASY